MSSTPTPAGTPPPASSPPPPSDTVELTIDGKAVVAKKGMLLVEAAKLVGIDIPVFCYHPKLKPVGACRMCVVEIEKMPRLQTACTTPVGPGMVVRTTSAGAVEGQQAVLEMLLANHPLDCPICDKGGECPLQDNTFRYGAGVSRMSEAKKANDKALPLSDRIVLDRERCILCYRCTRFQEEIAGDGALVALERGGRSEIGTLTGESFDSPFSGNTIELCPVGALTSRQYRFRARPWDLHATPSVCSGCSVGCNVKIEDRDGSILRLRARENPAIDDGWLCDHGRFQTMPPVTAPAHAGPDGPKRRALVPLVRTGGALQRASWDDALAHAARLLRAPRSALVLSSKLTNEALRIVGAELAQSLPGTTVGFSEPVVSPWPVAGRMQHIARARKIVDVDCDPWHTLPVLALWLRKAITAGAPLVVVGARNGLHRDTKHWLQPTAGDLAAQVEDLVKALAGRNASPAATAAAASLRQDGPAALLVGARAAADPRVATACRELAALLGANGETGFVGAPLRGTNARGAATLLPKAAAVDPLAGRPEVVFSFGNDVPVLMPGGRSIVATAGAVPDDASVEVVLPLAHPYETDGHYTNLEGVEQALRASGSGRPRGECRMDHQLLRALVRAAGVAGGSGGSGGSGGAGAQPAGGSSADASRTRGGRA
jgi:NADH-quinone oxidoreductase subunit G